MTAAARPAARAVPKARGDDGGSTLGSREFKRIAALVHAESGIFLPEGKAMLVYARLIKRLRALGFDSFHDYCALVEGEGGIDERQGMIAALTTNVTSFYREAHHFKHLKTAVLPDLVARARAGGRVRLWSAGCSRGHEPYSLAMTVLSVMPEAAERDVRILATDIDLNVLAEGRAGTYEREVLAEAPAAEVARHFEPVGGRGGSHLTAGESLRRLVAFRELNLVGDWPMSGLFDVVFCRNVAIYFDEATQARLWTRFAERTRPGGTLCIGHSERLSGPAADLYASVGVTTYRRDQGRAA